LTPVDARAALLCAECRRDWAAVKTHLARARGVDAARGAPEACAGGAVARSRLPGLRDDSCPPRNEEPAFRNESGRAGTSLSWLTRRYPSRGCVLGD